MKRFLLVAVLAFAMITPTFGQFSLKKVLFEEFTGAWCQYCADGSYRAGVMDDANTDALMVGVHNGDAMEISAGTDLAAFYSPAYPQALFNRSGALVSRGTWSSQMSSDLQGAALVTVSFDSVTYDDQTRQLSAVVRAMFTGPSTGDMRLNLIITEDSVSGTGSGYDQVNYDNSTPGHPYQGAGNPIHGFQHRHVAREYLDGAWGVGGLIPTTANFGTAASKTYTYTVPANVKPWDITLVAYVGRYDGAGLNERRVLNGEEFDLSTMVVGRDEVIAAEPMMEILGNPLTDRSKIVFTTQEAGDFNLEVFNVIGQRVATLGNAFADKGIHTLYWDGTTDAKTPVENGIYLVRLSTEDGNAVTKRIMVAH
jgi:hypothetical protein